MVRIHPASGAKGQVRFTVACPSFLLVTHLNLQDKLKQRVNFILISS
ncbi:MAG: hypothetical protein JWR67_3257, partial [Mucilaginibacter sp.]|nr:hypothetical protein [Mucilaginibacter sp.]